MRRDERGAVFPATLAMMSVVILVCSLVIDIGGDRIVKRDMQSVADVVALDVVRQLDGRPAGNYPGFDANGPSSTLFASAKTESLSRQAGLLASPDSMTARLAVTNKDTGEFLHWAAAGEVPNAVRVYASGSSAFRFAPSTDRRSHLDRSALAVIGPPLVCISAGATLADVTSQGILDTFLGKLVGVDRLSTLSPDGMAALDVEVPLLAVATQLNVGSVDNIATANVTARGLMLAVSQVLIGEGKTNPLSLLAPITPLLDDHTNINVSQILALNTGNGAAATLGINVFSLLQSVIMVSNKNHFIDLGSTGSIPGLGNVNVQAKVVEAPQNACGPVGTTARSAQIQLKVVADVTTLGGLVASAKLNPLFITVADGSGTITTINCSAGNRTVGVNATTAVGKVGLNLETTLLLGLTRLVVGVPDPGVKPNGADIGTTGSQTLNFTFPSTGLPPAQVAGTVFGSLGLSNVSPIKIDVIGLPVGNLLDTIVKPLLNIIDPLVSSLVRPTLTSLGVNVGTVKIQPSGRPDCNAPLLRG